MKYKVYYVNTEKGKTLIGTPENEKDAHKIIMDFLSFYNYHSYYQRYWTENGKTFVDVGSHSEFFTIEK